MKDKPIQISKSMDKIFTDLKNKVSFDGDRPSTGDNDNTRHSPPLSPLRIKGVESETALHQQAMKAQIQAAQEKRQKHYKSAPRIFSYEKGQIKKVHRSAEISVPSIITEASAERSQNSGLEGSGMIHDRSSAPSTMERLMKDRVVSTSYSESLEMLIKPGAPQPASSSKPNILANRRLTALREEVPLGPRLSSVGGGAVSAGMSTGSGISSSFRRAFDDDFIQFDSAELAANQKKKTAKIVGRYLMGEVLGEGSYGKVKEGVDVETLKRVAIKIMKQSRIKKIPNGEQNVKREIQLLKKLRHPNVVELMDVILNKEKQKTYVVFEYCAATLDDVLSRAPDSKLPLGQCQRYFAQMIIGLEYLHARGVVHRDIKPGNILLTFDDIIKISDFGVAEEISPFNNSDELFTSSGSPAFQPPEVAAGADSFSGNKVDVWAMGVTLYHMISGKYPFDGDSIYSLFENISKGEYEMPREADSDLADLIRNIMNKDITARYSVAQILSHHWMRLQLPQTADEIPVVMTDSVEDLDKVNNANNNFKIDGTAQTEVVEKRTISNPYFTTDSTVSNFLELMFEEMPPGFRRVTNVGESRLSKKNLQRKSDIEGEVFEKVIETYCHGTARYRTFEQEATRKEQVRRQERL